MQSLSRDLCTFNKLGFVFMDTERANNNLVELDSISFLALKGYAEKLGCTESFLVNNIVNRWIAESNIGNKTSANRELKFALKTGGYKQRIFKIIESSPDGVSLAQITRKTQNIERHQKDAILSYLIESGLVEKSKVVTKPGKIPVTIFKTKESI